MLDGQAAENLADPACQAGCPAQFRTDLAYRHAAGELPVGNGVSACGFGVCPESGGDVSGFHSGITLILFVLILISLLTHVMQFQRENTGNIGVGQIELLPEPLHQTVEFGSERKLLLLTGHAIVVCP